jgi:hypothetical protein
MTPTGQKATIYGEEFDKKVTTHEQNGATWNGRDADEVVTTARGAKDLR